MSLRSVYAVAPWLVELLSTLDRGKILRGPVAFFNDLKKYKRLTTPDDLPLSVSQMWPIVYDRYQEAGSLPRHYFLQDLWAAKKVFERGTAFHYDFGSRVDGFIAHCLSFCEVRMFDVRPLEKAIDGLSAIVGDILDGLPCADNSVASLSSLHAIEHVGLGRYGDRLDPAGHVKALHELQRIAAPGGLLLISTPVGRPRLEFNAQRVLDPCWLVAQLDECELVEFSVIDDGDKLIRNTSPGEYVGAEYACGLFHFSKRTGP